MGIYEFLSLPIEDQANAVWAGTFLSSRSDTSGSISLYDLGGFYVEVFYNGLENKIERFRPFKATRLLDPYLNDSLDNLI